MKKVLKTNLLDPMPKNHEKDTLHGYQFYPESEDNYYNIGGDDHNNLDEDKYVL